MSLKNRVENYQLCFDTLRAKRAEPVITNKVVADQYVTRRMCQLDDLGDKCVDVAWATVMNPATKLFVLSAETLRDVLDSENLPIDSADMFRLPFQSMWVEFDKPVEFLPGDAAIAVAFAKWTGRSFIHLYNANDTLTHIPFEDDDQWPRVMFLPREAVTYHTADGGDVRVGQILARVRNLYDFLTCRSFDYTKVTRPPINEKRLRGKPLHVQNALRQREYLEVRVNGEVFKTDSELEVEKHDGPAVEVPGCFYRRVYCKACGDVHRFDSIGDPCNKCDELCGPDANIEFKKFWRAPHVRGTRQIDREYVRHLVQA